MSGYSGNTSFDFEIERYKDKSGELLTSDKVEDQDEYDYETICLTVEGRSSYTPGKTFGLPENCYPDDGEIEILSVTGPDNKDWEDKLTEKEREDVLNAIDEKVRECDYDGPDPDDYYDDRD